MTQVLKRSARDLAQQSTRNQSSLQADLEAALEATDQLSLAYQPRVDLATGQCLSMEALLRWNHPSFGAMNPGEFIPIVENSQLMGRLTDWVLNAAMARAQMLRHAGHAIRISANVSPVNLAVGYLVGRIVELLRMYELHPSFMELEFTEGALIGDDRRTRQQLNQMRRLGVGVAIDDFGAGYSNLGYLKNIPADIIKIDRSLIEAIETDQPSRTIVKWLIALGHELNLRIVAEGIETIEVYEQLAEWGCDEGQGYLISKPMSADVLLGWLEDRAASLR
jgi:EAL domain-containing protein (putative c-di-GMP-specific phosphodiesterase class I)